MYFISKHDRLVACTTVRTHRYPKQLAGNFWT